MRIYKMVIIILFCGIIFLGGCLSIIKPDIFICETENRVLKQVPKYSKEKLMNGKLFSEFDDYFRDQVVFRKDILLLSHKMDMAMKKTKFNDVVIGKDGFLLEFQPFYPRKNSKEIEEVTDYLSKEMKELSDHIHKNNGEFLFVGIPTQSYYNSDKYIYPYNNAYEYQLTIENSLFSKINNYNINCINMKDTFKNYNEPLYYKTDHHYNYKGSHLTYTEIIKNLKSKGLKIRDAFTLEELKLKTIDKPFRGSWNSNLYWLYENDDKAIIPTMEMPSYSNLVNYEKKDKIYYPDRNKDYVSYGVYMDGDKAEQIIDTNRKELPNAVIFGESFTNALEPLLFMHFNETRMLDLRYYFDMNVYDYVEKHKPDVVIYVTSNPSYETKEHNNDFKAKYKKINNNIKK